MMKLDLNKKMLTPVLQSDLKNSEILERADLQSAIINSWEHFKKAIRGQDLLLIGQEINPHDDVNNRIDILAFSAEDSVPVVIELKRSKHKLQLLQSITYAAMISSWRPVDLLEEARRQNSPDLIDLEDLLQETSMSTSVRVVLLAEEFDPEVIIAADWLYRQHDLDVLAFSMDVFSLGSDTFLNWSQRYPLPELSDSYSIRKQKAAALQPFKITWDDVANKLDYEWGKEAIKLCQAHKQGEPARRRFGLIRTDWHGFNWISINFRRTYVNVYIKGNPDSAEDTLRSIFTDEVEVGTWRDGYWCKLKTQSQFQFLVQWLELI